MQVNLNSYRNTNPSFGMAKLTNKGREVVQDMLGDVPKFASDAVYTKKDVLADMLNKFNKKPFAPAELDSFFSAGMTDSALKNKMFADMQFTKKGQKAIKSFLSDTSAKMGPGKVTVEESLVGNVLAFFDRNISNSRISAKQGKGIIDSVKEFADPVEISRRISIVTDKIFSK